MHRGMSPSQRGVIHKVVVQKRIVMVCLKSARRRQNTVDIVLEKIICKKHQRRTDALSAQRQYIFNRFIQTRRFPVVRDIGKIVVNLFKNIRSCEHNIIV